MSSNSSNFSGIEKVFVPEFSESFRIFIYVIYNVVFVTALVGNSLVLYVVYTQPRMRTAPNYLLCNLAFGDLLICLLCVPFTYMSVLFNYWPFGKVLCHVVSPANTVGVLVSSFTLVALALDRYFAIVQPFRPRLRKKHAIIIILVIWAAALFTAIPIACVTRLKIDKDTDFRPLCYESEWPKDTYWMLSYTVLLLVLQYKFPIVVLIFTYTSIAIVVWGTGQNVVSIDGQQIRRPIGKTVVVTFAVVMGYTVAWLPLNVFTVYQHMSSDQEESMFNLYLFFGCHFIAMSHTTYNPFIYAWVNRTFRQSFKIVFVQFLEKCCQFCKSPGKGAYIQRNSIWQSKSSSGRSNYCQVNNNGNGHLRKVSCPTSTPISTQTTNVVTAKTN